MKLRRKYDRHFFINNRTINTVIIDTHFEKKHSKYMNDDLILSLVDQLNNRSFVHENEEDGYQYFSTDLLYEEKKYRLIWLLENDKIYIGIINAYRRK